MCVCFIFLFYWNNSTFFFPHHTQSVCKPLSAGPHVEERSLMVVMLQSALLQPQRHLQAHRGGEFTLKRTDIELCQWLWVSAAADLRCNNLWLLSMLCSSPVQDLQRIIQGALYRSQFFVWDWSVFRRVMDQFRGLFAKLDQNDDGFVSVAELHDEMKRHGILSADGKVQVIIMIIKSDLIHSFINVLWVTTNLLIEEVSVPSQTIIDSYDKDKDGLLDYKEFLRYLMDREKKWKIHFHDLDKNKCGESRAYGKILHVYLHLSRKHL